MTVVDTLIARNRDFAARQFTGNRPLFSTLQTLLLGCVDPRVDPAHLLCLQPGEAAVIRNIGGRVTPATLREIAMLAMLPQLGAAGAPRPSGPAAGRGLNIVVLHHTDCGITRLAKVPDRLADYFGVTPDELEAKAVLDPYAAVRVDVAALRADPSLPSTFTVSGLVYDVATGLVEVVVPPAPLRDGGQRA